MCLKICTMKLHGTFIICMISNHSEHFCGSRSRSKWEAAKLLLTSWRWMSVRKWISLEPVAATCSPTHSLPTRYPPHGQHALAVKMSGKIPFENCPKDVTEYIIIRFLWFAKIDSWRLWQSENHRIPDRKRPWLGIAYSVAAHDSLRSPRRERETWSRSWAGGRGGVGAGRGGGTLRRQAFSSSTLNFYI